MGIKSAYLWAIDALFNSWRMNLQHWQDPEVFYINTERHHTPLRVLTCENINDVSLALSGEDGSETSVWRKFLAKADKPTVALFKLLPRPDLFNIETIKVEHAFAQLDGWKQIHIPSNWQLTETTQDPPIYTNFHYPWPRSSGLSTEIPVANPTGIYLLQFDIPASWITAIDKKHRDVFLILHGAGSGVDIYLNGDYCGYGQDSMTETEVCISSKLCKNDPNILILSVYRWTDGSYLEDQDQWWLSGVFRDIELCCRPIHDGIVDYFYEVIFPSSNRLNERPANVKIHVLSNTITTKEGGSISCSLYDADEEEVLSTSTPLVKSMHFGHEKLDSCAYVATLSFELPMAKLWRPENPYLYTAILKSQSSKGQVSQIEAFRLGVRTISISNGQLLLNEKPVLICGTNRHEWDPNTGKVIKEEDMIKDIKLMKKYNFNAVRNSHYPNSHRWYQLCDEFGLLVFDEANLETHGFIEAAHMSLLQCSPRWKDAILARTQAMVRRARNYSCIVAWSLGNESGCGPNLRCCADWVHKVDPFRPIQYEGGIASGDSPMLMGDGMDPNCTDIICPMYFRPIQIARIGLKKENRSAGHFSIGERPIILCEYGHAMGNSSGNLHQYWALFKSHKTEHRRIQGGFIWDWVDQGLRIPGFVGQADTDWGYGGDFGSQSGKKDRNFCVNGLNFPNRHPHPAMEELKYLQRPIQFYLSIKDASTLTISAELFQHCVSTEYLQFTFRVRSLNIGTDETKITEVASMPPIKNPCGKESESGKVKLRLNFPLPHAVLVIEKLVQSGISSIFLEVEASLSVHLPWAEKGHIVSCDIFDVKKDMKKALRCSFRSTICAETESMSNSVQWSKRNDNGDEVIAIQTNEYLCDMDLTKGRFLGLRDTFSSRYMITPNDLEHCFYRAPTDNDRGGLDSMFPLERLRKRVPKSSTSFAALWREVGLDALEEVLVKTDVQEEGDAKNQYTITFTKEHRSRNRVIFKTSTQYAFQSSNIIVNFSVKAEGEALSLPSLARVGVRIILPGNLDQIKYLGRGPFECYPDRKAGTTLGIFSETPETMHTPYLVPSECGGRSDVQWAEFSEKNSEASRLWIRYAFPDDDNVDPEYLEGMDINELEPSPKIRPIDTIGAQFSASRYSVKDLAQAQHQCELPKVYQDSQIHVHFDTAMMGLGGDVSWQPQVHNCYRVKPGFWRYQLTFSVKSGNEVKKSAK